MLDRTKIKEIIPHRDPFLLVDEVLELDDKSAKAIWKLTGDEYFFKGHFPGQPILPGVLMVESLAQVGAIIALSKEENKGKVALFGKINNTRFKKTVVPGDTLELNVEITKAKGPAGMGMGKAYVDGELVCSSELTFFIN